MNNLYTKLFPLTHHFYPLQQYTKDEGNGFEAFISELKSKKQERTENLLYVHIPYCEQHCLFCPFHVRVNRKDKIYDEYVKVMVEEMELMSGFQYIQDMTIDAVYIGGGSPSLLSLESVKLLLNSLEKYFNISKECEWTFEGEPNSLSDLELLHFLDEFGVQRISYGVQTFDQQLREKLNIGATLEDVIRCTEKAKKFSFKDINIDMMYHMPGHTMRDLEADISAIDKYGFDSVDYYYLSYYGFPKKVFLDMEKGLFPKRPPESLRHEMNKYIQNKMQDLDYDHVTDHVFSKLSKSSDYYRLLWGGGDGEYRSETLAIGSSARGYINGYSYANTTDPKKYMQEVRNGEIPLFKVSSKLSEPENRGFVFFPKFFKIEKWRVQPKSRYEDFFQILIKNGLMEEGKDYYYLTSEGKDWIPNITNDLLTDDQAAVVNEWLKQLDNHYANKVTL
ncbi:MULTISPECIES: coproporphyrinogen-III oxidase family protein [unclassified Bacillus cereus group]|uniref:coproporphyrinogen-III oxidase family protein n=1 Tax=unclassified Bacillus cereus group TaxID=2750818 RepID=UPI001F58C810|nr:MULTISPECIES: radical SAM protein [unclassified Bacillus cereus group]